MIKTVFVSLSLVLLTLGLFAQNSDLTVMGVSPGLYLQHTVAAKENWYSVGRLYNISPKEIAPINGTTLETPLSIGQQIKVPLTPANFSQSDSKAADEAYVPVYHVVQDKEWMFRVSTNYNKVPIENLEKWNNINRDQAKAGMKLVVGYLKVKKDVSALASRGTWEVKGVVASTASAPPVATTTVATTTPATTSTSASTNTPATTNTPVSGNTPAAQPVAKAPEKAPVQQTVPEKQAPPAETKTAAPVTKPLPAQTAGNVAGGYFRSMYEESGKAGNGSAGVFKSTSGWQDGKYYALMNNVAVGTIVKVTNPATSKAVYAKVLGQLPDMKESVGLTVRVSDAAATELGSAAPKFPVEISY